MLKKEPILSYARLVSFLAAGSVIAACSGGGSTSSSSLPPQSPALSPQSSATTQSIATAPSFSVVQTAHGGGVYNSSTTIHLSKNPAAGDVLVLFFEQNKSAAFPYVGQVKWPAAASGSQWSFDGSTSSTAILHHVVQAGEAGAYTVNVGGTGSGWSDYMVAEVAGANTSNPVNAALAHTVPSGSTQFTFGSGITPTTGGTFPVAFFSAHESSSMSWSSIGSGWTIANRNGDYTEMLAYGPVQTGTSSLNVTATLSQSTVVSSSADVVLLNPASGSSGGGPLPSPAPSSVPSSSPSGKPSPVPTATPVPIRTAQPSGSAPFHIETWGYDEQGGEGSGASPSVVAQYLTYAESAGGNKVLTDCHTVAPYCKAMHYDDPNRQYMGTSSGYFAAATSENWYLHAPGYSDSSHRLQACLSGGRCALFPNQTLPAVQAYFRNEMQGYGNAYDGVFMDDTGAGLAQQVYGTGQSSAQELTSDAQNLAMHQAMVSSYTHADGSPYLVVANTTSDNPWLPSGFGLLGNPSNAIGAVAEGTPIYGGGITSHYPSLLDRMAAVNKTSGFLTMLSYGSGIPMRMVHIGTIWLGYAPGHEVSWEDLSLNNSSDIAAWPEETIYPTQPLESMSSGNGDLLVTTNVWRREFGACYLRGQYWGHCAALVNTNGSAVSVQSSWLKQSYTNTIQLVGGEAQDPSAAVTLGALQSSVPGNGALLLYGK